MSIIEELAAAEDAHCGFVQAHEDAKRRAGIAADEAHAVGQKVTAHAAVVADVKRRAEAHRAESLATRGDDYRGAKAALDINRTRTGEVERDLAELPAIVKRGGDSLIAAREAKRNLPLGADKDSREQADKNIAWRERRLADSQRRKKELTAELAELRKALPALEQRLADEDLKLLT